MDPFAFLNEIHSAGPEILLEKRIPQRPFAMPQKLIKIVLTLLALIISPMILGMIASAIFIAVHLANGESFSAAVQALTSVFQKIKPFLPYITGIPAFLILMSVVFTNRYRIQSWFRK